MALGLGESGGGGEMAEEAMAVAGGVEVAPKEETVAFRGGGDEAPKEKPAAPGSGGGEDPPEEKPAAPGSGGGEDPPEDEPAALGIGGGEAAPGSGGGEDPPEDEPAALGIGVGEDAPEEEPASLRIGGAEDPEEEPAAHGIGGGEDAPEEAPAGLGIGGGEDAHEDESDAEVLALNDDIISLVLAKLPTGEQYRCSELAREWRYFVSEPFSLKYHFYPPPIAFSALPAAVIVQPKNVRVGYVHLVISTLDHYRRYSRYTYTTNLPVHRKYEQFVEDVPATHNLPLPPRCLAEFLEKTVPMLDLYFVASYGSVLLANSPTTLFLCIPATDRWIKLPQTPVALKDDTAFGISYTVDHTMGRLQFLVVVLSRVRRRRLVALTFSSELGHWMVNELGVHSAARCLGPASPGIHARGRFFWMSRRRPGRVVCYDVSSGRVSVFREPPVASGRAFVFREPPVLPFSTSRKRRTLGSVDGRLRFCAVDMIDGNQVRDVDGIFSVWKLNDHGSWERVHKEDVHKEEADTSMWMEYYLFQDMKDTDSPMDFSNGSDSFIVMERMGVLQERDLSSGGRSYVENLSPDGQPGGLHPLYRLFDVFPVFM